MRIIISIFTDKRERAYAIDFNCSWPFIWFENLTHLNVGE